MLRSGHAQAHINGPEFLLLHLDTCQPTLKVIEWLIRSSARIHGNTFCQHIAEHLSQETRRQMDALLDTESYLEDEAAQFKQSEFNFLKTDPGRLGLKSLRTQILHQGRGDERKGRETNTLQEQWIFLPTPKS